MSQRDFIASLGHSFLNFWDYWSSLPRVGLVPLLRDYLDNVDPALQPNVIIMDLMSPSDINIRLAGTAVVASVGEITNSNADEIYERAVKSRALEQAWAAANHPCGYTVLRTYRTLSGLRDTGRAFLLTVETTSDRKSVVIYNGIPYFDEATFEEKPIQTVIDYYDLDWIDIGAGTPT